MSGSPDLSKSNFVAMDVAARFGEPADQREIEAIWLDLAQEVTPLRGGPVLLSEWEKFGQTPSARLGAFEVVGTIDNQIVGFGDVTLSDRATLRYAVGRFGVIEAARGVGVAKAMFDLIVTHCRDLGATGVDVEALPGARETKNFFESFGFKARKLTLHKQL